MARVRSTALRAGRCLGPGAALIVVVCTYAAPAAGSEEATGAAGSVSAVVAAPLVVSDPWAIRWVEQLDELGHLAGHLPAQRVLTLAELERAAATAVGTAEANDAVFARQLIARLTRSYLRRHVGAGFSIVGSQAWISAGASVAPEVSDPFRPLLRFGGANGLGVTLASGAEWGPNAAARLAVTVRGASFDVPFAELVGRIGPVRVSLGRAPVSYGFARAGGILLSGNVPLDRFEAQSAVPARLNFGGRTIPISAHFVVGRLVNPLDAAQESLVFSSASMQIRPHPQLVIAAQRGVVFGGPRAAESGLTLLEHLGSLGGLTNSYENNIASVAVRYNSAAGASVPVAVYGEWGMDDSSGGHLEAPGIILGARIPLIGADPSLQLGTEYAYFGTLLCCRPKLTWYLHGTESWVSQTNTLGHPLGGNGEEVRVFGDLTLLDGAILMSVDTFRRIRTAGNLFGSDLRGESFGVEGSLSWRIIRSVELGVAGAAELARAWRAYRCEASATWMF